MSKLTCLQTVDRRLIQLNRDSKSLLENTMTRTNNLKLDIRRLPNKKGKSAKKLRKASRIILMELKLNSRLRMSQISKLSMRQKRKIMICKASTKSSKLKLRTRLSKWLSNSLTRKIPQTTFKSKLMSRLINKKLKSKSKEKLMLSSTKLNSKKKSSSEKCSRNTVRRAKNSKRLLKSRVRATTLLTRTSKL